ncbi:MAG TPA: hypothetical protein VJR89_29405, partial [Polyangiales bacterium]|nr:hypothetical protein [Polyangiales bacterium]
MTRVDLHPEELLDQLRAGTLSGLDAARLDAHCRSCAACRLELQLASGRPFDRPSAADRALADAVTSRMLDPRRLRAASRRRTGILVLGAALGCSLSAAAFWSGAPVAAVRAVAQLFAAAPAQRPQRPAAAPAPSPDPLPPALDVTPALPAAEATEPPRRIKRRAPRAEPAAAPITQPPAAENVAA